MHSNKQQGSLHVIIIVIAAVVLVGAIGFMFWNNIINKNTNDASVTTKSTGQNVKNASNSTSVDSVASTSGSTTKGMTADQSGWVVINPWGVKFKAPADGTTISWAASKYGGVNTSFGFTTNHLTKGDICTADNAAAGALSRDTVKFEKTTAGSTRTFINNGQPINGYYYAYDLPNGQHCDNTKPSDYDEALKIQGLITTLTVS